MRADRVHTMTNRLERIVLETDRHRIVGDLSLPKDGYLSRLSDYLNRDELVFIPLTDAVISPRDGDGEPAEREFIAVARMHVELAYPVDGAGGP